MMRAGEVRDRSGGARIGARGGRRRAMMGVALVGLLALAGCKAEVLHGLDEPSANEVVVVLEQSGVAADKQPDPNAENGWLVRVPSGSTSLAWRVLQAQGLPRAKQEGFSSFYPSSGLIPTTQEERVLFQYATAQELRKSLLSVDGVVDARINLVLPDKPRLRTANTPVEPPRASVLIKFRPNDKGEPPLGLKEVRELIAGGVEGMSREHVAVIFSPELRSQAPIKAPMLAQVGPVSVSPESKTVLQGLIGALFAIVLVLGGVIAFLVVRRPGARGGA